MHRIIRKRDTFESSKSVGKSKVSGKPMDKSNECTAHTLEQVIVERWSFVGRRIVGNVRLFDEFKRKPM